MNTENALVALDDLANLPSTQMASDEVFEDLAKSTSFLGRLQLYTKGSAINRRLIGPGEFGIPVSGDEIIVIGESVDVLPLARRPKAIDMNDSEAILVSYDPSSETFKDIAARSSQQNSNCMHGVSFLVIERTTGRLLEFFCGTKSTRSEAGKIYAFLPLSAAQIEAMDAKGQDVSRFEPHGPLPMTMRSKLVEKGTFSWHVPVVLPCSTPFTKLPSLEAIREEQEKFLSAKDNGVEKADEAPKTSRRAR